MKRFWRLLGRFFRAQKCWRWPRHSEVLIFDACEQEVVLEYLRPWKPEVLHVRGEQVNIRVFFASLFKRGRTSEAYVDCFIKRVRPRLIVTFIDNNLGFYLLARRHQNIKTLFIQNGFRGYYGDVFESLDHKKPSGGDHCVNYMMTFGSRIGAEYARYIQGVVVPIGSIKNNRVPNRHTRDTGTIGFVSQYRNIKGFALGGRFYTFQAFFEQADRLVLSFLVKYAKTNGKELFIVPCTGHYEDSDLKKREQAYYNQLLGQDCIFSEWSWRGSSYDSVDMAEVVVSIDSTLGYESAARGNKTAIFSIRTQLLGVPGLSYGWPGAYPDDGPFWTNCPDPVAFGRILDHLFAINDEQRRAELAEHGFASIMAYDPGNTMLQSVLSKELGEPNTDLAPAVKLHNSSPELPLVVSNHKN